MYKKKLYCLYRYVSSISRLYRIRNTKSKTIVTIYSVVFSDSQFSCSLYFKRSDIYFFSTDLLDYTKKMYFFFQRQQEILMYKSKLSVVIFYFQKLSRCHRLSEWNDVFKETKQRADSSFQTIFGLTNS